MYAILPTPFHADERVDLASLRRVVDVALAEGVDGVVCHGLASEGPALSEREQDEVLSVVVEQVDGRVDVVAGSQSHGAAIAAARARAAESAGANALMLTPAPGDPVAFYGRVADAVALPIIVQDAQWHGISLPVDALLRIAEAVPSAGHVKLEVPPTARKITALRDAGLEALGGAGGVHLMEELDRGVSAVLPAAGYLPTFVAIMRAWREGRHPEAQRIFERSLPLTVFSMQGEMFVGVHKWLLWRRGLIASPQVRHPVTAPDARQLAWAERLAELAGVDLAGS